MNLYLKLMICFSLTSLFFPSTNSIAQNSSEDIVIGKFIEIQSKILNEERGLFVYLPPGYYQSSEKYPVLYILDGEDNYLFATGILNFLARNGKVPRIILVAIPNTFRNRDSTPTFEHRTPGSGGADNFINFIREELFPFIEQKYRTHPYKILYGHSLFGMFSIYTLFTNSDLFDAYIAVSPDLMWDSKVVLNKIENLLKKDIDLNSFLYVTLGNEPVYINTVTYFISLLKQNSVPGLSWEFKKFPHEFHETITLKSLYNGLESLYKGWQFPKNVFENELDSLKNHYKKLSIKYGYKIKIPEGLINNFGYLVLRRGKIEESIKLFKLGVELYPNSANAYDSLGEAQESKGKLILAFQNYQRAFDISIKTNDPNIQIYKEHLVRVQIKLSN